MKRGVRIGILISVENKSQGSHTEYCRKVMEKR